MSYILDALRKSEQERQLAEGKSAGLLYPVTAESRRSAWSGPAVAVGVAVVLAAIAGSAYLLLRSPSSAPSASVPPAQNASVPSRPIPSPAAVAVQPPPVVVVQPPIQEIAIPKPITPVVPAREKPTTTPLAKPEVVEARSDEMPPINISGYIRDGEAGGMAMINDKLVREGEEVLPGLRLEKILPEGAVFNYKGRRFTR